MKLEVIPIVIPERVLSAVNVCVVFNVKPYGQNRRMPGDEGILGWGLIA